MAPNPSKSLFGALVSALLLLPACGGDDPGYFLAGRLIDGAGPDTLSSADVRLLTGSETRSGEVADDGTWSVGPIAPGTSYQLVVEAPDRRRLVFTGQPLPAFEGDADRTVIRDLYLYSASAQARASTVELVDIATGEPLERDGLLTLRPVPAGLDPAFDVGFDEVSPGIMVSGVTRQPRATSLPNDGDVALSPATVALIDGRAEVPPDILRYGATYGVELSMTGRSAPVAFAFTALDADRITVGVSPAKAPAPTGGSGPERHFSGRVYDGLSLARITDYSIRLEYHDAVLVGAVDRDGRYVIGPLTPQADYSVVIEADGYRSFLSHNARLDGSQPDFLSLYYDAFLYPDSVPAPQAELRVLLDDGEPATSGYVRLAPRGRSSLFDEDDETPAGVNRQIWDNDEDLQQRAVSLPIANGVAQVAEGDLVIGVAYRVTVYGVPGQVVRDVGTFTAGQDGAQTYVLTEQVEAGLMVVSESTQAGLPIPSGEIAIRFDRPIELDPLVSQSAMEWSLNQSFSIYSPDADRDGVVNRLRFGGMEGDTTYRGVTFRASASTLTLRWDPGTGLETSDMEDPIQRITYGGLNAISVRPVGGDGATTRNVAALLGRSSLTAVLNPN